MHRHLFSIILITGCLMLGFIVWQLSAQTPPPPPGDAAACPAEVSKAYTKLVTDKAMTANVAALGWAVQLETITKEFGAMAIQLDWTYNAVRQWQKDAAFLLKDNNALRQTNAELTAAQLGQKPENTPPAPAN